MKNKLITILSLSIILFISSCTNDEPPEAKIEGKFENSALIINEGIFNTGNSSVSALFLSNDSLVNEVFYSANSRPLGDLLQSIYKYDTLLFQILNGSGKIEVASANNFAEVGVIKNIGSPRYMSVANELGFVSDWATNQVKVVDMNLLEVVKSINTGTGPEAVLTHNNLIWVANGGSYTRDSTLTVIDPITLEVVSTIVVGDNPKEMTVDINGDIWVLCSGYVQYEGWEIILQTPSKLVKVSSTNLNVISEIIISESMHPFHLDINPDKDVIYYSGDFSSPGIFELSINDLAVPTEKSFGDISPYGFNVNPENGDIYVLDAGDFQTAGTLIIYNNSGVELASYSVGLIPNGVLFN